MVPDLDELLSSIQDEAKRERALALYEGTRDDDLVSEEVDERILKLLGLDDVFDIDYATYMSLLRGKMAEARMVDKKLSTDETMLLTDEFKRVKGKVGRFKLKKKKITAENLGVTGPIQVSKQQYFLTSKAIVPETSGTGDDNGDLLKNVITINETVSKILESISAQNKLIKKGEETERKKREEDQRKKREEGLEKGLSKIASVASKILAPVRGILDKILNFILYTLLGRAFVKFIDWFNDPKNKEKVEVLKRFLKDWWPTLLGALVLFTTPFGKFVRGFIGTVTKLTLRLAKFAIPKLLGFVKSNPKTAALLAAGTAAVGTGIYMQSQRGQRDKELQGVDPNYGKKPGPMKSIIDFGTMGGMQFKGGGMVPLPAFDNGGYVDGDTGVTVTGAGADTQATVLQPGEVVFSKSAVDYWGADRLLTMNKIGGGTNIPKFVNNIQMVQGGGIVGTKSNAPQVVNNVRMNQGGGILGALGRIFPGTGRVMAPKGASLGYQNKFLGMNIGGVKRIPINQTYSPEAVDRYNSSPSAPSRLVKFGVGPLAERHISVPKSQMNTRSFVGPSSSASRTSPTSAGLNLNLKQNIQTIRGAAQRQESMMRELGYEPDGYVNLRGQPINLGPQSRSVVPGPPISNSKMSFVELPPIVQQSGQQVATAGGTKVPQFMSPDTTHAAINASIYGLG